MESLLDQVKWELLNQLIQNGELKEYQDLYAILNQASKKLSNQKDSNVKDLIDTIIKDYVEETRAFVETGTTPGISSGIGIYNGPEINVYYGKTSGLEDAKPIDETVRFDGASITKMYTALQYILKEFDGIYSLDDPINTINPEFSQDTTLRELLSFYHVVHTDGKLETVCSNEEEAISLLKKATIAKSGTFLYSDIPYMMASLIDPNFRTDFEEIFVTGMGLNQTGYTVASEDTITGGAMHTLNQVHDPKARILSYAGHAGIYTTTHDSLQLFQKLIETGLPYYISSQLATPFFSNGFVTDAKGNMFLERKEKEIDGKKVIRKNPIWVNKAMGVYIKHPLGLEKTDVLPYQSKYAFAADGFTGVWLNYDLANQMSANIFTNPLSGSEDGKKPKDYIYTLDHLKEQSIKTAITLQYAQKVFETYYEPSEDFQKRYIK